MLEDDVVEAARIAAELDRLERRAPRIEQAAEAQAEAEAMAALGLEEKGAVVVTAPKAGIPAWSAWSPARLKERFARPAFAIALEPGGIGTGSGRSIAGVDLGKTVRRAVERRTADQRRRSCHGRGRDACARTRSREFRAFMEDALAKGRGRAQRTRSSSTARSARAR